MIHKNALGLAGGILWGAVCFLTTLISVYTGYADAFLGMLSTIYPGYTISLMGSFVGLVYGFIDGFIGLYLLALLYTYFEKKVS